jgi:anti-sigma-K factor RskA
MRTRPLLGRKAWFGPRRNGWGLQPVSAEGWVVSAVAAVAAIVLATAVRAARWTAFLPLIVLLVLVFVKGTSPGGQREWEEFQASKHR